MTNNDEPQGGVRLDMQFGEAGEPRTARNGAEPIFKLVVIGDFGGAGDGAPRDISNADIAELLASFGAAVTLEVPNRLGSMPASLAVRLPLATLRDLDPKTLAARIPELAEAERLAAAFAAKGPGDDFEALARETKFDHVADMLRRSARSPAAAPSRGEPAPKDDDGSLDRLLGMIDVPTAPAQSDAAKAAVSAFVSSLAKPSATTPRATPVITPLVESQVREVATHAAWLRTEAGWRSLRSIMAARGTRSATRILLCDVARDGSADLLHSETFTDAFADAPDMAAILIVGAFGKSAKDLDLLDRLADAAGEIGAPVIVSLAQDFFGVAPEALAKMDNPRALLEAPAYAAWQGLRGRNESRWLFAAWNDVVLRTAVGEAPILWGEPGAVLAAQILRSLARCGWPTEILGAEAAVSGLEVAEVTLPGGRSSAIPLHAPINQGVARDLGAEGLMCLVCRADRDQAWFTRAPSLHAVNVASGADRPAMERFESLPFRFVSTYVENLLQRNSATISGAVSNDDVAAAVSRLLEDALATTGPGAAVRVARLDDDDDVRRFEVTIRLGQAVMDGFVMSFELAV